MLGLAFAILNVLLSHLFVESHIAGANSIAVIVMDRSIREFVAESAVWRQHECRLG